MVSLKRLQEVAGHMDYLGRFVQEGILRAQEAYVCLNARKDRVHRYRPVTKRLVTEMKKLLRDIQTVAAMPWLAPPFVLHAGPHGFPTDACAPSPDGLVSGGWGVCVFGFCAYGAWSQRTIAAFDNGDISISPAELILAAAAVVVGFESKHLAEGMHVVWRTDNDSA